MPTHSNCGKRSQELWEDDLGRVGGGGSNKNIHYAQAGQSGHSVGWCDGAAVGVAEGFSEGPCEGARLGS